VKEYPFPDVEFGITQPAFAEMWGYLPFMVGFPGLDIFMLAIPTALIAYIIAFGDIIVGKTLLDRADHLRQGREDRDGHRPGAPGNRHPQRSACVLRPYPGLAGPIWTAVAATTAERYK